MLVKRLYVSAKLIKQTNCCEKLSDLPSFPRAGALLRSIASCIYRTGSDGTDQSGLRRTPLHRCLSLPLSSQRVGARLPTGSPGLLFSDWFPTATGPPSAHHHQHSFFLRRKFFCGLDGAGDAAPPVISRLFPPPTPNHLFPTVCDGRCSETCPAPDSANLGGLLVMLVSFQ